MKRVVIDELTLEEFDHRLQMALTKARQSGIEEGQKKKEAEPAFFTITELMTRWKCSDETIKKYEKKYNLKRKIIGNMIRFSYTEVIRFENSNDLLPS